MASSPLPGQTVTSVGTELPSEIPADDVEPEADLTPVWIAVGLGVPLLLLIISAVVIAVVCCVKRSVLLIYLLYHLNSCTFWLSTCATIYFQGEAKE